MAAVVPAATIRASEISVGPRLRRHQVERLRGSADRCSAVNLSVLASPHAPRLRPHSMQQLSEAQVDEAGAENRTALRAVIPNDAEVVEAAPDALLAVQAANRVSQEVAAQTAKVHPIAKELAAGRQGRDAEAQMRRSLPRHWNDEGDGVCLTLTSPLTCRIACTLPIRARPEKPCGVDWSKNKFVTHGVNWSRPRLLPIDQGASDRANEWGAINHGGLCFRLRRFGDTQRSAPRRLSPWPLSSSG